MGFISEARASDSPYIETVARGRTEGAGATIRPAESRWHMVVVKYHGRAQLIVTGALTTSGVTPYTEGVELLWIKFALGVFMPSLPAKNLLDRETILPGAACQSFLLNGSAWQFPDYDNVETYINRLVRAGALARDPVVEAVLQGRPQELAPRTVRHRFLRATGMTQGHIYHIERAQRAASLLRQGMPILDTVYQAGYFDQPHLTRSLKRWVGHTPAHIVRMSQSGAPE